MKKLLTIIVDGFGIRGESKDNAIVQANMHTYEQFFKDHPHALLDTSNEALGLLPNEEVSCKQSHKIMGGGRLYHSDNYLINEFWDNYSDNEIFNSILSKEDKPIHLLCFLRKDNLKNVVNCYNALKKNGIRNVYLHLIVFQDTSDYLDKFYKSVDQKSLITIVGGDYLDDSNDNGILKYYNVLTNNVAISQNVEQYLNRYENWNSTLNTVKPVKFNSEITIGMDDTIIWLDNHSKDTKLIKAFADLGANVYTYFKYNGIDTDYFIDKENTDNSLGMYLGRLDVKQARVAQDEKFEILNQYFDCTDKKISSCDKYKIDGIDNRPEMSIVDITKRTIDLMDKDYSYIVINFANCDVYGQKGNMNEAIQACMSVDVCLAKLIEEAENNFYTIILIGDHGRAENIKPGSSRSTLVPFIISDDKLELRDGGSLKDYAPTILDYMEITIPEEMTGESLIVK